MNWLIWKEYRVNRLILFLGLALLLVPHAIALVHTLYVSHACDNNAFNDLENSFQGSTNFSLMVTQIVLALLGGNAIAGERADRSAEFLACLPFSRLKHLISKLVLAPLTILVIWGVNMPIFYAVRRLEGYHSRDDLEAFAIIAVTSLTFFCVGWLASSLLNSAVYSVCLGLITPLFIIMGIQGVVGWLDIKFVPQKESFVVGCWHVGICAGLSLVSFIVGTWYYLRRVEP